VRDEMLTVEKAAELYGVILRAGVGSDLQIDADATEIERRRRTAAGA